jgi:hypothetical protein
MNKKGFYLVTALVIGAVLGTTGCKGTTGTQASTSGSTPVSTAATTAGTSVTTTPGATAALFLNIMSPANEAITDVNTVTIKGQTTPDAVLSINGDLINLDAQGNFSVPETLNEGTNIFDIIATDEAGNQVTNELIVSYAP